MSRFDFTKLTPDEALVFGPLRISKNNPTTMQTSDQTLGGKSDLVVRKVGVTTQRIIIEQGGVPEATQIIPHTELKRIAIRREKFAGQPRLVLDTVETKAGQTIRVDLTLLDPQAEAKLQNLWPDVPIQNKRGCLDLFPFLQ